MWVRSSACSSSIIFNSFSTWCTDQMYHLPLWGQRTADPNRRARFACSRVLSAPREIHRVVTTYSFPPLCPCCSVPVLKYQLFRKACLVCLIPTSLLFPCCHLPFLLHPWPSEPFKETGGLSSGGVYRTVFVRSWGGGPGVWNPRSAHGARHRRPRRPAVPGWDTGCSRTCWRG